MNLNQITVPSTDLTQSVKFYSHLGLQLIVDALPRYVRFECPDGDSTFSVHLVDSLPARVEGVYVYFECEDIDAEYKRLVAEGIVFDYAPQDQKWLWREARLKDPDGNQVVLFHGGKNRKNPPWRV